MAGAGVHACRKGQAGSSWLELAVAAALIAVFAAVLLSAVRDYQLLAERTVVKLTIMNMRSGMRYRIAELILAGRTREISGLVGANPVAWLSRPPEGYLGELNGATPAVEVPPGAWAFDRQKRELVYRVHHDWGFKPLDESGKVIRLAVVPAGASSPDGSLLGVAIVARNRYDWQ